MQDVQWVNRAKFEKPAKSSEHICILTSYSRNCAKLKPLTYQNKFDYAKKHGYSFRVYSGDDSTPPAVSHLVPDADADARRHVQRTTV